jgi:hypothetical protein
MEAPTLNALAVRAFNHACRQVLHGSPQQRVFKVGTPTEVLIGR